MSKAPWNGCSRLRLDDKFTVGSLRAHKWLNLTVSRAASFDFISKTRRQLFLYKYIQPLGGLSHTLQLKRIFFDLQNFHKSCQYGQHDITILHNHPFSTKITSYPGKDNRWSSIIAFTKQGLCAVVQFNKNTTIKLSSHVAPAPVVIEHIQIFSTHPRKAKFNVKSFEHISVALEWNCMKFHSSSSSCCLKVQTCLDEL